MGPKGVIVVLDNVTALRRSEPEALEHIANRPIAQHVVEVLESAGVEEIVVVSSVELAGEVRECLAAREQRNGARLQYVEQRAPIDVAGALRVAAPIVDGAPCIVHLASGLLDESLMPLVSRVGGDSPDVVLVVHQGRARDGRLNPATQDMLHIAELDPQRAALAMAGVWAFGPGALGHICATPWRASREVDLTMVVERIADAGGTFHLRRTDAWRQYVGDPIDLLELNRMVLNRLKKDLHRPHNDGNRVEGPVRIDPGASVRASVIIGPTVIGPGARIADAYIGPYTSIGADARIEGAEIEQSIVSAGASIVHVGDRVMASVVGPDARIFRDFSLPRALRIRVGRGTEVALC